MRNPPALMLLATLWIALAICDAETSPGPNAPYSVHEWGTFTSIQDSSGRAEPWNPFGRSDLPAFVHSRTVPTLNSAALCVHAGAFRALDTKANSAWLMRMETPVLYFHARQAVTVDVEVQFPSGLLTEWYPQVSSFGPVSGVNALIPESERSHLTWNRVRILDPHQSRSLAKDLRRGPDDSHYYAARDTSANLVEVAQPFAAEAAPARDRFLFYRGAGNAPVPLGIVRPAENRMLLVNRTDLPLGPMHVIRRTRDHLSVVRLPGLDAGASLPTDLPLASLDTPLDAAVDGLVTDLAEAGLNRDEAQAMVATWRSAWLEEPGVRVLYLLPQAWSDEHLPLKLHPKPHQLTRVFVGRADSLDTRTEARARFILAQNLHSTGPVDLQPWKSLGLGRFTPALLSIAARQIKDENGALTLNGTGPGASLSMTVLPMNRMPPDEPTRARRIDEIQTALAGWLRTEGPSLAGNLAP